MEIYRNLSGESGVVAYAIGAGSIDVKFKPGRFTLYSYTYASAGKMAVDKMQLLAEQGSGLNSYISTFKPPYASRR